MSWLNECPKLLYIVLDLLVLLQLKLMDLLLLLGDLVYLDNGAIRECLLAMDMGVHAYPVIAE